MTVKFATLLLKCLASEMSMMSTVMLVTAKVNVMYSTLKVDYICDPVSQTSHKVSSDQFVFIANLETLCLELQKDVSVNFTAHRKVMGV